MASAQKKNFSKEGDDIVHALWRHREKHEQGIPSGSWGWITSFLENFHRKMDDSVDLSAFGRWGIDLALSHFVLLNKPAEKAGFCLSADEAGFDFHIK